MFRYIAICWDDAKPGQASFARQLSQKLQRQAGWHRHPSLPGLHVFTTGMKARAHGVYDLPGQSGTVLGRLFRRSALGTSAADPPHVSAAEAGRIVRTEGLALVRDWWGSYVAFLPAATGGMQVLRDPSGALPCFVMTHRGVTLVFSWLEDVLQTWPEWPLPDIDWNHLGAHVLWGRLAGPATALQGVQHVPAGCRVPLNGTRMKPEPAWNAVDFARRAIDVPPAQAAERLRQTVRDCARAWAACHDGILLRLSGGVDSAILLACLQGVAPPSGLVCLNYHAPGADGDERAYARLAATRAGRPLIERACDATYPLRRTLDVALTPAPESYMGRLSMAAMDAELAAAHHTPALFTGGGGDQLFFELRCTWPAADYLWVRGLDAGWPRAVADAARLGRVSVWRSAWLAMRDALAGARPTDDAGGHLTLLSEKLRSQHVGFHPHPALRQHRTLPIGKYQQASQLMAPAGCYDPYLREAAPENVNPLLSQPVMELCLALPTYLLTHGGRGRALARQAFAAEIPVEIATRRTKGGLEEHLTAVLQNNLEFARDTLLHGQLVGRGLLDARRVETALASHPTAQGTPVGEIHNCIAVEAWLQRWSSLHRNRPSHLA